MKKFIFTILTFIGVSFVIQALSHFVINTDHYASVSFMREPQIIPLGILTMVIQGAILAYLYPLFYRGESTVKEGLKFGLVMGVFLVSYIALVEPAKYIAPSVILWIAVEGIVGIVQFSIFGMLIGLIHGRAGDSR